MNDLVLRFILIFFARCWCGSQQSFCHSWCFDVLWELHSVVCVVELRFRFYLYNALCWCERWRHSCLGWCFAVSCGQPSVECVVERRFRTFLRISGLTDILDLAALPHEGVFAGEIWFCKKIPIPIKGIGINLLL